MHVLLESWKNANISVTSFKIIEQSVTVNCLGGILQFSLHFNMPIMAYNLTSNSTQIASSSIQKGFFLQIWQTRLNTFQSIKLNHNSHYTPV